MLSARTRHHLSRALRHMIYARFSAHKVSVQDIHIAGRVLAVFVRLPRASEDPHRKVILNNVRRLVTHVLAAADVHGMLVYVRDTFQEDMKALQEHMLIAIKANGPVTKPVLHDSLKTQLKGLFRGRKFEQLFAAALESALKHRLVITVSKRAYVLTENGLYMVRGTRSRDSSDIARVLALRRGLDRMPAERRR